MVTAVDFVPAGVFMDSNQLRSVVLHQNSVCVRRCLVLLVEVFIVKSVPLVAGQELDVTFCVARVLVALSHSLVQLI